MTESYAKANFDRTYPSRSPLRAEHDKSMTLNDRDFQRTDLGLKERSLNVSSYSIRSPTKSSANTLNQSGWTAKRSRGHTPKKIYFLSDYLQGYDPAGPTDKTPNNGNTSRLLDTSALGNDSERLSKRPEADSRGFSRKYNELTKQSEQAPTVSQENTTRHEKKVSFTGEKDEKNDLNTYAKLRLSRPGSVDKGQPALEKKEVADSGIGKRTLEHMKLEVKERISKLSEKLVTRAEGAAKEPDQNKDFEYEPLQDKYRPSNVTSPDQSKLLKSPPSFDNEAEKLDSSILSIRKSTQGKSMSENFTKSNYQRPNYNKADNKENDFSSPYGPRSPSVLGEYERKSQEIIYGARPTHDSLDFRHSFITKQVTDTSASERVTELENQLKAEKEKNRQLQEQINELKKSQEDGSKSATRELEKKLKEKDRKISELEENISSMERTVKDLNHKAKFDQESAVRRVKTEYEFEIKKLTFTIEAKDRKIAQLERDSKVPDHMNIQSEKKPTGMTLDTRTLKNEASGYTENERPPVFGFENQLKERFSRSEVSRFGLK